MYRACKYQSIVVNYGNSDDATKCQSQFGKTLQRSAENREVVIINRSGNEDVALIAAHELSSLFETAHLLRSPKNAQRLLVALNRARSRKLKPQSVAKLRREMKIEPKTVQQNSSSACHKPNKQGNTRVTQKRRG